MFEPDGPEEREADLIERALEREAYQNAHEGEYDKDE
jgi:hypothetical protein